MSLQGGPRQYSCGPGSLPVPVAPAVVASGRGEKEEQGGRRVNNIGDANVVILNGDQGKRVKNRHEI